MVQLWACYKLKQKIVPMQIYKMAQLVAHENNDCVYKKHWVNVFELIQNGTVKRIFLSRSILNISCMRTSLFLKLQLY